MFIDWKSGHLNYIPVSPCSIRFKYHDKISDNEEDRGVDYTDIDDATVMVIKLAGQPSAIDKQSYLAINESSDQ
jgi:hypothetical protein